ncbi:MAG: hypothetical protein JXA42_22570 [Anaerolineales bacterium]|nr:hypothetical protein [Anaerolineales bacterium]
MKIPAMRWILAGFSMLMLASWLIASPAPAAPAELAQNVYPDPGHMEIESGPPQAGESGLEATDRFVVLAWNDLGMHCYNADFQYLAVLPPYNTLWAQVIKVGNPPEIIADDAVISVTYTFADNTYSVGKSNFWEYDQQLFGVNLPANVGLAGKGLSGDMDPVSNSYYMAEGIPLTEYRDSQPTVPYPYQLATVTAWDAVTGIKLAETQTVAPVSTEMHCNNCHSDGQQEDIATGSVELNILTLHDEENQDEYPAGHKGALVGRTPILCAECHASNALGKPGVAGIPSLSRAIHDKHKGKVSQSLSGCYQCHPGPQTQCLRDVMSQRGMDCIDCHGTMEDVSENPNPWLLEPRCDAAGCHNSGEYDQDQALYRMSRGHGNVYCEACHDSPHAIAPSRESNDSIKFIALQGKTGTLDTCTVCHAHAPTPPGDGPHGIQAELVRDFTFGPDFVSAPEPGSLVVYTHTLANTGNLSDTYQATWSTSQGWANISLAGRRPPGIPPIDLEPGERVSIQVDVTVPDSEAVRGLSETTIVTMTSQKDNTLVKTVRDFTLIPRVRIYFPILFRQG